MFNNTFWAHFDMVVILFYP